MLRDDAHVPSHDLHALEAAGKRPVLIREKPFRPDADPDFLIRQSRSIVDRVRTDVELSGSDRAVENIDRRGSEEFGDKKVRRIVVD